MQESKRNISVSIYVIAALMCFLIINQGGYFAGGIISAGLIVAVLLLLRANIRLKPFELIFLSFSLWYLFCSVRTGFDIRHTAKGILPLMCLMFRFLIPDDSEEASKLCEKVIKISFYITILAIFICIYYSAKAIQLQRLAFPFQYSNASGIFFGVMFILSRYAGFEWARKRQYVFFAALVLTQSVGAVGLTVLAELVMCRNKKETLAIIAFVIIGTVLLKGRVYQSMGTFVERILQMRDGLVCMADNFLFGIGAGRWELVKNLYQSGFYNAREIHSSIVQIGTDSGITGLILLAASLVAAFRNIKFLNKAYLACVIMIICHSCLDFSMAFAAIDFILVMLFACGESKAEKVFEFKPMLKYIPACAILCVFITLSVGMYQINTLSGIYLAKDYNLYISYYESNKLVQSSIGTTENYATSLLAVGDKDKCRTVIDNIDVLSSDMIVLKKGCSNDWKEVLNYLEEQPYNTDIYNALMNNCDDEALKQKAQEMMGESVDSMSFLGKILYNFKGEDVL